MPYSGLLRGRVSIGGQIHLVTTVTRDRAPLFTNLHLGRIVVRTLHSPAATTCATTLAYVVMPDHFHWLLQLRPGSDLSEVVKAVKGKSSFEINCARGVKRCVWQPKFRARLVRRLNDYSLWDAIWVSQESG